MPSGPHEERVKAPARLGAFSQVGGAPAPRPRTLGTWGRTGRFFSALAHPIPGTSKARTVEEVSSALRLHRGCPSLSCSRGSGPVPKTARLGSRERSWRGSTYQVGGGTQRPRPQRRLSSPQGKATSGKMYQSLALAPSPGQAAYADSGAFLHASGAASAVFVPPARVPSMLSYLPTCEPGSQPSALAAHPGWAQAASADSSAFGSGSPHPPASQPAGATSFSFSHSAPGSGGGGAGSRDGSTYQGALLARDQYQSPLGRPAGASYPTAYPAYVSAEVAPPWTSGPFEGGLLHGLQSRPAGFPGRRATLGECGAGAAPLGPRGSQGGA